ncbi:hypothetical protein AZI86_13895 [Bdellovibrio bacteriovorus]|uniref:Uncharacterized protein n=1 Tax=Bdellovibrio bacteriovorus TaxID=959 RepID=A0A150WJZ8_BDEBC|nr:hypothetical protein [Bdellovibrio bacteriovorus]KYG63905.1 hypothetical protein AZI86_13895 [Bdellovibrio bacteriovorus]
MEARLPRFLNKEITIIKDLPRGHFEGLLGDKKVFIKKLRASSETELAWLEKINSLGLGVELYGTLKIQDQTYAVMEFFEGVNTQIPMMAPSGFILTKKALGEIQRQAAVLAENQIIPVDLQFQISLDGQSVKIVDPELFKQASSVAEARAQTLNIFMGLKLPWMMEGKLEL